MPTRTQIANIVQDDVETSFGGAFPASDRGGFRLLNLDGQFEFTEADIPDDAEVSAVAWQYDGVHARPLVGKDGTNYFGDPIPVIDKKPEERFDPFGPQPPGLPATGQPVRLNGVTLVIIRSPANVDRPMLMRFIDWADVFTQLGFDISTRGVSPEPGRAGTFRRLDASVNELSG